MRAEAIDNVFIQISLDSEMLEEIPALPARYVIYSQNENDCTLIKRYSGQTMNLQDAIRNHFKPNEPLVDLRYFMISLKKKILSYTFITF
jgi:hypothetical protein